MDPSSAQIVFIWPPLLCLLLSGVGAQQALRTEPRNQTVRMGATALLKCEVLRASGTVQWVKDGLLLGPQRSLPGFPRYSMVGNPKRGQFHLQIERAELDDDAQYECQVGQSESSQAIVSNKAWFNVQIPPSKPYFETDLAEPWVAGRMYTVTCIGPDAKPKAELQLYKDGVELTGAESFTMSGSKDKLLNTHAKVTLMALSSDDGRELSCRAGNPALAKPLETVITMKVYFPPPRPVIEGLERDEVMAGDKLKLACVSHGGNPLATLHWTKNGEVLSTSWEEDLEAKRSSSTLFLQISPEDNKAEFCCESTNLVAPSPLSVSRKITVLFEPAKVTVLGSFTATEGKELTLSCYTTSSNPPVQVRWWLGFRELNGTGDTVVEGDNGGMTTMSNMTHRVSREENGLPLTCEAFNKGTRFSKSQTTNLNVYYPPLNVWLDGPPKNVPLRSGTTVRLVCFSSGGNPTGTLTWLKNGKPVQGAPRQMSFDKGVSRELVLVLAPSDNMATYRCDAKNQAMKVISAETKLMVQFPAGSVKIIAKQKEQRQGQTLSLECLSGSSNPESNISWSLGSLRLAGVEQAPRKAEFGGVSVSSTLSLPLASKHNKQRVVCQAYSSVLAEGANTFYRLNVQYPPEFSPVQPKQVQVFEDDMATIPLLVSANPEEISCTWLHHKEKLVKERDPRYEWSGDSSLEIRNVTRKDAGVYKVQCANEEGVKHTSITLDVQYAPSVKAEKDLVHVNLGETADLICVADANPITAGLFSWKWLGEGEMAMGEETQEEESGLLTIHNVTRAHAGRYQCTADNKIAPPASADVQLLVHFKPEIQKGVQWRKVASRGDGSALAEVVCRAEGVPRVHFSWAKNNVPLDFANPRYEERTVREGSFHTSTVLVVNVSALLDYAIFTCNAHNSLGEDTLDIQLVSTTHPDPPSSFRQLGVTHNSVALEWIPGFDGGLQQRFRIRATMYTVTGLLPFTTYNFSVNALNAMGESAYADNNAVLTIATEEWSEEEEVLSNEDSQSAPRLPTYLTVTLTVIGGVLLALNSLGCILGLRWKQGWVQTGRSQGSTLEQKKNEEAGSSQSTVRSCNRYESRDMINATARQTFIVDSGSETEANIYESYAGEGSRHSFCPRAYCSPLYSHPEEVYSPGQTANVRDTVPYPAEHHGHVYEDVREFGLYQDAWGSFPNNPTPLFDNTLPGDNRSPTSPTYPQGSERMRTTLNNQLPHRDYDVPFELRGELV